MEINHLEIYQNAKVGDKVIARFTNCNRYHKFLGEITGITKNYYKVLCLEDFRKNTGGPKYDNGQGLARDKGRVFHISTLCARQHSNNNCISEILNEKEETA